ncbi:MAG TPA: HAMP domain-containing sensor histidine kinase [Thermoanaerobaculia bacterium]|nr:HAMP domain-containing sensor histidine kinase [Thermoanaerobaculia bacterium]
MRNLWSHVWEARRPAWARYGLALASVVLALLITQSLEPWLGMQVSPLFFVAVLISSLYGGTGPGLLATLLSTGATAFFHLGAELSFRLELIDMLRLAAFFLVALVVSSLSAARRRAEDQLRHAIAELESLERAKDRFIASLSHELRTPLTAILGWTALARSSADSRLLTEAIENIESSARAQARLVDDLLEMSRIILGKLPMEKVPFDLVPIVAEVVEMFRPEANRRGLRLSTDFCSSAKVVGDPTRLRQLVWNLLANAVKFTSDEGAIHLALCSSETEIHLHVRDSGRGISADLLPHVFDPLRQGDGAEQKGGLGLGLAITRHVALEHGGTIRARSQGVGEGAEFEVILPRVSGVADASSHPGNGKAASPAVNPTDREPSPRSELRSR